MSKCNGAIACVAIFVFVGAIAPPAAAFTTGDVFWAIGIPMARNTPFPTTIHGMAVDTSGNTFVVGEAGGTIDLGGGDLVPAVDDGDPNVIFAKYDRNGDHVWSRMFGPDHSSGIAVAIDPWGNPVMAGRYFGTVNLGDESSPSLVFNGGAFVAKFTTDGKLVWRASFERPNAIFPLAVAIDDSGDSVVVGNFAGTIDNHGVTLTADGHFDAFAVKYNGNGDPLWSQSFGGTDFDSAAAVEFDGQGDLVVSGSFEGIGNFGGVDFDSAETGTNFLAKYGTDGSHIWSKAFGSALTSINVGIAVDGSDEILFVGGIRGSAEYGGESFISAGERDVGFAKFGADGAHRWSQAFGGSGVDVVSAVAVDALNNAIISGGFQGPVDLGGGPISAASSISAFFGQYDANGVHLRSGAFGNDPTADLEGVALAADPLGDILAMVSYAGSLDTNVFGVEPILSTPSVRQEAYIVKFRGLLDRPVIDLTPAGLFPSVGLGGTAADQNFDVTNVGGATMHYTILDDADWLSVAPAAGFSDGETVTHTVSYDTAALAPGTHHATITIEAVGADNAPQTIDVTLTVLAPTLSVEPPMLSPSVNEGGIAAPQSFTVTNVGPGTLNYTISDTAAWLFASPAAGSSTGESDTIQVLYGTPSLAPGEYSALITVTDIDSGETEEIVVALTVEGATASTAASGTGGGCFIATATYGTPMTSEIDVLRRLRDEYLLTNPLGAVFVDAYYRSSPPIADAVGKSDVLRGTVRLVLAPVIATAQALLAAGAWLSMPALSVVLAAMFIIRRASRLRA